MGACLASFVQTVPFSASQLASVIGGSRYSFFKCIITSIILTQGSKSFVVCRRLIATIRQDCTVSTMTCTETWTGTRFNNCYLWIFKRVSTKSISVTSTREYFNGSKMRATSCEFLACRRRKAERCNIVRRLNYTITMDVTKCSNL